MIQGTSAARFGRVRQQPLVVQNTKAVAIVNALIVLWFGRRPFTAGDVVQRHLQVACHAA